MTFDPELHHRRSIRLRHYDYSAAGFYFVTLCTQGRENLFGNIVDGMLRPDEAGKMVEHWWLKIPEKFETLMLDEYIVMPNHFHGILAITAESHPPVGADPCVCPHRGQSKTMGEFPGPITMGGHAGPETVGGHMGPEIMGGHMGPEIMGGHTGPPLHRMVQWFKTITTNAYIHGVNRHQWPAFPGRLWQRNYYERIIRNETELDAIRQYIADNPTRWADDAENPANRPNNTP